MRPHAAEIYTAPYDDRGQGWQTEAGQAASLVGPTGQVTGLDFNAGMLAVARTIGPAIRWVEGSAVAMDFPDASFDVILSALHRMIVDSGFGRVEIRPRTLIVHLPSIETFVLGHLSSSPVAGVITAMGEERAAALGRQVKLALQPYAEGDGVSVPDEVNIAIVYT